MFKITCGVFLTVLMAFGGMASAQRSGYAISDSFDNNSYIAPEEDSRSNDRYSRFDDSFDTNNFREPPEDEGSIHPETRGYYETHGSGDGSGRLDDPDPHKAADSADEVKTN